MLQTQYNELKEQWYEKLKDEGFEDIENTSDPNGPLKEWHSFKFVSLKTQIRRSKRSEYQNQIDSFANDPAFPEVIKIFVKHGNSMFTAEEIQRIWDLHREGWSQRAIAKEMECSQPGVFFLLKRMREWMRLL